MGYYGEIVSLLQKTKALFNELIKQINIQMANLRQKPIDIKGYFQFVIRKFVCTPFRNHDGNTKPIIYAIQESYPDVTQLLLENGAKLKGKYLGFQGKNALEMVIISRNLRMLKIVLAAIQKLPARDGYDNFNTNQEIFELAVDHLNMEGMELLIKHYLSKAGSKHLAIQSLTKALAKSMIKKKSRFIDLFMKQNIGNNIYI